MTYSATGNPKKRAEALAILVTTELAEAVFAELTASPWDGVYERVTELAGIDVARWSGVVSFFSRFDLLAAEKVDAINWRWERLLLPIITDSMNWQVGPTIVPRRTGCYTCYATRAISNSSLRPWTDVVMRGSVARGPGVPERYLRYHASLIAAQIPHVLASSGEVGLAYDSYNNVLSPAFTAGGIHGCPRCSDAGHTARGLPAA